MSLKMLAIVTEITHGSTGIRLNANEKLVLTNLANFFNDDRGCAWPGMELLSKRSACELRSLRRILRRLEREHCLISVALSVGRGRANEYRFNPQMGLFGCGNPVEKSEEKGTLCPEDLRSSGHRQQENRGPGSAQLLRTVNTKTPYGPPKGDESFQPVKIPNVVDAPSYLHHYGKWIEVHMGRTRRLFTREQWNSMAGIAVETLLERIRAIGFRARIVPDDEVATWKKERTA
jgi:hypothetical protein